jgi:hypothetical protein
MDTTTLVKSISIANLANRRIGVLQLVRHALDLLNEAEQLASAQKPS